MAETGPHHGKIKVTDMAEDRVLRVSAFSLVQDITPWQQSLEALGMSRHGGADRRCLGFGARGTTIY